VFRARGMLSKRTEELISPLSEDFCYETGNSFPGGLAGWARGLGGLTVIRYQIEIRSI
jgi:hypothetical protein